MGDQYLLECDCGQQLSVGVRQAGQAVRCGCGNTIGVPSLRDLRRLPLAHRGEGQESTAWSQAQGFTFVTGSIVATIAVGVFCYYLTARLRFEAPVSPFDRFLEQKDLNSLTPEDSWLIWQAYQHYDLQWGHSQVYVDAQRNAARLSLYMGLAAGVALLGVVTIAVALFGLKPVRRPAAIRTS